MLRRYRIAPLILFALLSAAVPAFGAELVGDVKFGVNEKQEGYLEWRMSLPSLSRVTYRLDGEVVHTTDPYAALTGQHYHVLPHIEPGRTYTYEIEISFWSDDEVIIIEGSFDVPAAQAPANVWAIRPDHDVWVFWDKSFGAARYAVFRSTAPNGDFEEIAVVDDTFYVDAGLVPDTTYYYAVQAISASGTRSDLSEPADGSNNLLQEGRGVAFPDLSGNGNHGFIGGTPRWISIETADGSVERGVMFDNATNQYIRTLTTGHLDGATHVVMELDVYYDDTTWRTWGIVGGPHSGTGSTTRDNVQFTWTRRDPSGLEFRINARGDSNEHWVQQVIGADEYDGTWVTLRAEYNNGEYSLYANGELKRRGHHGTELNTLNLPFYLSTPSSNYNVGERVFKGSIKRVLLQVDGETVLEWDFATLIKPE